MRCFCCDWTYGPRHFFVMSLEDIGQAHSLLSNCAGHAADSFWQVKGKSNLVRDNMKSLLHSTPLYIPTNYHFSTSIWPDNKGMSKIPNIYITRNYSFLYTNTNRKSEVWISSPFNLYSIVYKCESTKISWYIHPSAALVCEICTFVKMCETDDYGICQMLYMVDFVS